MKKYLVNTLIVLFSVMLVVVIGGGIYMQDVLSGLSNVDEGGKSADLQGDVITPASGETLTADEQAIAELGKDTINVLCLGVDSRNTDGKMVGNTDVMMIATVDLKSKTIRLTSLMRDMYVAIPGHGKTRINAAFASGGADLALQTVNQNFGLNLKHYAIVDFISMEKIINRVGSITIDVREEEVNYVNEVIVELNKINREKDPNDKQVEFLAHGGEQQLNGRQAVAYARVRHVGNSDYERTARQRKVLIEMFKKVMQMNILDAPGLVQDVSPYIETNLTPDQILSVGLKVLSFKGAGVEQLRVPMDGAFSSEKINGAAVLVPNIAECKKTIQNFIVGLYEPPEKQY
nr:LCP family protein [Maliibacterium massiliense]